MPPISTKDMNVRSPTPYPSLVLPQVSVDVTIDELRRGDKLYF